MPQEAQCNRNELFQDHSLNSTTRMTHRSILPIIQNLYAKTRFRVESEHDRADLLALSEHENIAILSAYATTGQQWTDAENTAADHALQQDLASPIRITGYDPTGDHQEPSWALALPLDQALQLGTTYKQLAIFTITAGTLTIHSCCSQDPPYEVGNFLTQLDHH